MRLDVDCGNTPCGDVNVDLLGFDRDCDGIKLVTKKILTFWEVV